MNRLINRYETYRGLLWYRVILIIFTCSLFLSNRSWAQNAKGWELDKMPANLETEYALSSLPPRLRSAATVYLLDPAKGYYVAKKGTNGFVCLITRTNWEWSEFRKDLFAPMGFDAQGAKTILPMYLDAATMRASGKFTPPQIKDTVANRVRKGFYKSPTVGGVCYMLAPIMRVYTGKPGDNNVMTMNMPHYMFYAPYIMESDVGFDPNSPKGPWLLNAGNTVLGSGKGPEGYFIVPANEAVTARS